MNGTKWEAKNVLPNGSQGIIRGNIFELFRSDTLPNNGGSSRIIVSIMGKQEFPYNGHTETNTKVNGKDRDLSWSLNLATFESDGYYFEIKHKGEHTDLSLRLPDKKINDTTYLRLYEAFQFITGKLVPIMAVESVSDSKKTTLLRSPFFEMSSSKLRPPIHQPSIDLDGSIWKLFYRYFLFITTNKTSGTHVISRYLNRIVESSSSTLDAQALSLSVATEGLAAEYLNNLAPVSKDFIDELELAKISINSLATMKDQTKRRISGAIDSMRSPRGSDIINKFIKENNLSSTLYHSWKKLRHPSAHGKSIDGQEIAETLQHISNVIYLFYSMVFTIIGYTGAQTNYSVSGWPTDRWPVEKKQI